MYKIRQLLEIRIQYHDYEEMRRTSCFYDVHLQYRDENNSK
jgi:hypothetical protein